MVLFVGSIYENKSLEKLLKFYDRLEKLDVTAQKPVEHSWYNIDKFGFV